MAVTRREGLPRDRIERVELDTTLRLHDGLLPATRVVAPLCSLTDLAESVGLASMPISPGMLSLSLQPEGPGEQGGAKDAGLKAEAPGAPGAPGATGVPGAADADKSGTDPTKFYRTLGLRNEFQRLTNDRLLNISSITYIEPFADGRMNLRLKAPLVYADVRGDGDFGVGDLSLRYNWLPYVDKEKGFLLSAELIGDTGSKSTLGRGKWTIGPAVTYAMFLSPTVTFAPAYQHNVSFAGRGNRGSINESVIDFYLVFTADDKKSWVIVDPTLVIDWRNKRNTPFTLEGDYGRNIGVLWGGALNFYVRPGGRDRAGSALQLEHRSRLHAGWVLSVGRGLGSSRRATSGRFVKEART